MITIPLQLSDELARQVLPLQDRLTEIIELGLRQLRIETDRTPQTGQSATQQRVLAALDSTGIVTLPRLTGRSSRTRRTPIYAGGPPASEMIIAERRQGYEPT
jgi:hypothetical protein